MKSGKYRISCIRTKNHQKSLQQFNQVVIILGDNKLVITESKTFHLDLRNDAGIGLKRKIYSIIKHNQRLVEHTIKSEVRQLLSKYKHGNDIHEHGIQQND